MSPGAGTRKDKRWMRALCCLPSLSVPVQMIGGAAPVARRHHQRLDRGRTRPERRHAYGHRPGSVRRHAVPRRCRLRRPPARAPRQAVASAQVRTAPPALPPTCCTRPRAVPAALPAAQAPRRLRYAAVAGDDFPNVDAARLAVPYRRGGLGFHTRRILDARRAMADHGCDTLRLHTIVRTPARP